jgi:hypothetical protein
MSGENAEEALCMRGTIVVISNWGQVDIEGNHFVRETHETPSIAFAIRLGACGKTQEAFFLRRMCSE